MKKKLNYLSVFFLACSALKFPGLFLQAGPLWYLTLHQALLSSFYHAQGVFDMQERSKDKRTYIEPKEDTYKGREAWVAVHEMMYEAGAAKPWVMYVYSHLNNVPKGYFRIKSTTPHTFDWSTAQLCSGFSQLGNKTGYVDVPGGRLYMRISHTANSAGKRVPTFRFSSDGLNFDDGSAIVELIGHPSLNTYFLGFTTDYGTGANAPLTTGGTQFSFQYGGAASTSAVAPDIFNSDIWLGKTNMTVTGTLVP